MQWKNETLRSDTLNHLRKKRFSNQSNTQRFQKTGFQVELFKLFCHTTDLTLNDPLFYLTRFVHATWPSHDACFPTMVRIQLFANLAVSKRAIFSPCGSYKAICLFKIFPFNFSELSFLSRKHPTLGLRTFWGLLGVKLSSCILYIFSRRFS